MLQQSGRFHASNLRQFPGAARQSRGDDPDAARTIGSNLASLGGPDQDAQIEDPGRGDGKAPAHAVLTDDRTGSPSA